MPSANASTRGRNAVWLWLLVPGLVPAAPLWAHEPLSNEADLTTRAIQQDNRDAHLYLHRAELFRLQRQWDAAEADYARTEALQPGLVEVALGRASLALDLGEPHLGLMRLSSVSDPDRSAQFWRLKSRAHEACGDLVNARDAQRRFLASAERTSPQDHVRWARLGLRAGDSAAVVLDCIETSIAHVGPASALQRLAITLELQLGNYEGALSRLDTQQSLSGCSDRNLMLRAEILERAGRAFEARAIYTQILERLETRRQERPLTRAKVSLEQHLRGLLSSPIPPSEADAKN